MNQLAQIFKKKILNSTTIDKCFSNRGVSAFRLDNRKIIVVMAMKNEEYAPFVNIDGGDTVNNDNDCFFYFYNDNLEYLGRRFLFHNEKYIYEGWGLFLKGLLLKDDYFAVAYYNQSNGRSFTFNVRKYKNISTDDDILIEYKDFDIEFKSDVNTNELCKLDDNRLIFISTYGEDNRDVHGNYGLIYMFLI